MNPAFRLWPAWFDGADKIAFWIGAIALCIPCALPLFSEFKKERRK